MIGIEAAYAFAGAIFAAVALASALDGANPRRWINALFWALFAASFLIGGRLSDFQNGVLVLALVGTGALGLRPTSPPTTTPAEREDGARRWGSWLFLPVLMAPAAAVVGTLVLPLLTIAGKPLFQSSQVAVLSVSLAVGVMIALATAMIMVRPPLTAPVQEARRLLDAVGTAAVLPQLLAALGAVFVAAGVGHAVGDLIGGVIDVDSRLAVVATYCLGMAAFTMIMGNAFAAFPVLTAGVGAPLILGKFHGDPAVMGAIGMLSGFCGTAMTPMASFNIVPTALLKLPAGAVIRAQAPTAVLVLIGNIALMYFLVFRAR
jgi:uncharacterized membrane protein